MAAYEPISIHEDDERLHSLSIELGIPGNVALARYIDTLHSLVEQMREQIDGMESRYDSRFNDIQSAFNRCEGGPLSYFD